MSSNPAFFHNQPPRDWDIIGYLNQYDPTSDSYNHAVVIDKWTKALASIESDGRYTAEQRDKARLLLSQYKNQGRSSDRYRAREWLGDRQRKKKKMKSGASVTIYQAPVNQGTFNNATFHQGIEGESSVLQETNASCAADTVYQAPVNQGTFNGSTFHQAGLKRKLPEDWGEGTHIPQEGTTTSNVNSGGDGEAENEVAVEPEIKKGDKDFISVHNIFVGTYRSMSAESKFVFSGTHRVLEDVIYENARALPEKSSAHLWVIDLDDSVATSWFQPKELEELRSRTLPLPEADKVFVTSMARFSLAKTAAEYRRIAEEVPYRPEGESYDRSKHFDAAWVNTVILSMLSILESPNNLLLYPSLREGWFDCNPWSFLIDHCLIGLDGVLVQRKEILCLALKLIENVCGEPSGKGNQGRRFDAIIHTLGDSPVIEYGAIEVAKSFESTHTKKWMNDSAKLVHALSAMLSRLHALVGHDESVTRKLQVVGLLNAGVNMQIVRMNGVNGNVFLFERGKVRSVPTTVGSLKSIFAVMRSVVMFKEIIRNCVKVVKGYSGFAVGEGAAQTEQEFFEELMAQNDL